MGKPFCRYIVNLKIYPIIAEGLVTFKILYKSSEISNSGLKYSSEIEIVLYNRYFYESIIFQNVNQF